MAGGTFGKDMNRGLLGYSLLKVSFAVATSK